MSRLRDRLAKKKEGKLLDEGEEEAGVSNPTLEDDGDMVEPMPPSGTDSSPEMEAAEADALVKTLKTKRTKKKRELAKDLISPKDDLARELKEAKKKSRQKVDESILQEQEETLEVAEDGTLPMPEEEEEVPGEPAQEEEAEESRIKKLKKKPKTEETPIEPPPGEEEEEGEREEEKKEEKKDEDETEKKEEEPVVEPEPETERKTPRMASLRSKMRDRLQKAKDEAMTEVREEAKETRRERRLKRDKKQTTRFDTDEPRSKYDEMDPEDLERLTEERRKQREERKKRLAGTKKEGVYMPTAEEAYEFFTRNWDPEPEEEEEAKEKAETEVKEKKEKKEGEEEEGEKEETEPKEGEEPEEGEAEPKPGKPEDEQPLLPEYEDIGVSLTVNAAAYYPDQAEVVKKENEIYFYPAVSTIPATDKVSKEAEVRRLEEEGFYVGTRPTTSGWNLNRMEHRILKESEKNESTKKWFGEDGKLVALPDPLRALPSRPPVSEEEEPYLETAFKKALIREFDMRYIDGSTEGGGQYQLDVDINQIIFSHHHLFSREHVLAQRLGQLFEQYVLRQRKNMTEYLGEKTAFKNVLIREFDMRYIDGSTEGGGQYQLDVDINQIIFSHHHLFSREHVLAQRLGQLFEQYVLRQRKNMTEYLGEKEKKKMLITSIFFFSDNVFKLTELIINHTAFKKALIREFDMRYIDGSTEGGGQYQLDVDINQIIFSHHHLFSREHVLAQRLGQLFEQYVLRQRKNMTEYLGEKIIFSHHHLFSREHVLAQRLGQLFEQYVLRQRKNMTEYLGEKLKALKNSSLHLQDHIAAHRSEHSLTDRANYDKRLQDYKYEIRQTRALKDKEEMIDRKLLKNMIHTWKEIKSQRELQGFTNTPVKLQVRKEEVNKEQDIFLWKQEIEDEVEEQMDEHDREYKHRMLTYEEQMAKYKKQQEAKKEAEKRLNKKKGRRSSRQSGGSAASALNLDDYTEEQQKKDEDLLEEPDLDVPEQPEHYDAGDIRGKVEAKAKEIRRRPGEPRLYIEVTNTTSVTPTPNCPTGEQKRRNDVSRCKVFVKILFNNKEVERTPAKPLTQEFKVTYGTIYNLRIVQWPDSIKFQVYETMGLGNHLMAELCAPIPDTSVTSQSVQLEELEFSSDHRINHSHEGVGSGLPFTFGKEGQELLTLMTTGTLGFSVAWAVDEDGVALVPPSSATANNNLFNQMKKMDPVSAIGASGVMDLQRLADWFANSRLDPNDPNNADIVYMLRPRSGDPSLLMPSEFFRLEQLMQEFDFISEEELNQNRRFQLLQFRDEEIAEFRNYKQVPAFEREIPRDTFTDYERKKREEQRLKQMEDIESHRAAVKRFRQRIREQVMRRFRVQAHMKRWDDMVYEEAVPNVAMLGTSLLKLTERRAPLKPKRKERKKVTAQNIKGDEVKIVINITRAQNIPVRTSSSLAAGTMTARGGDTARKRTEQVLVRPFVEIMFQHQSIRTSVADGPNPSFNEELEIPFKAPNDDYSPSNLQTLTESIFLNLFDEVVVDIQQDDREKGTMVHQRIEKKWLGSLKIPFTTIYFNGKIDGTFRVDAPPVLLGYTQDKGFSEELAGIDKNIKTLLSLFITIEPPLTQPEPVKERFSTNEDERLMVFADEWMNNMTSRFTPKREVKTFVTDVNFKSVFITRYFRPIKPPDELLTAAGKQSSTAEVIARYVSLIPFISDSVIFPGLCDIWNTCDQFLQMLSGDEEEHAIMLVNFFLHIGKKAWLICGVAIPEGPTAYVLSEEDSGYWIWNPSSGEHFRVQDMTCPLQSIGCLVNHENIWANIQQYDKPAQMSFKLSDTSCWETIFGRGYPDPQLGSIQPESLYYFPTDKDYVTELQEKIQQVLKNKIMDWRSRYITRWNRHCTQIMRKLLPVLEENCGKTVDEQHIIELEQSFSSYKVSGFPINMPFTEMDPIVEAVYATGVHAQESSDVEYALAVYVHPYPNSVLSVWVYVASLNRIR